MYVAFFSGARYEDGTQVDKVLILKMVMACRDSHTSEQYNANRRILMELTDGLMIKPGRVKHEVTFRQYYDINWENIQPMWVLAFRKKLPLQVNGVIVRGIYKQKRSLGNNENNNENK